MKSLILSVVTLTASILASTASAQSQRVFLTADDISACLVEVPLYCADQSRKAIEPSALIQVTKSRNLSNNGASAPGTIYADKLNIAFSKAAPNACIQTDCDGRVFLVRGTQNGKAACGNIQKTYRYDLQRGQSYYANSSCLKQRMKAAGLCRRTNTSGDKGSNDGTGNGNDGTGNGNDGTGNGNDGNGNNGGGNNGSSNGNNGGGNNGGGNGGDDGKANDNGGGNDGNDGDDGGDGNGNNGGGNNDGTGSNNGGGNNGSSNGNNGGGNNGGGNGGDDGKANDNGGGNDGNDGDDGGDGNGNNGNGGGNNGGGKNK